MNSKSMIAFLRVTVAAMFAPAISIAHAQSVPPACQQYVTALKVCGAAYVQATEVAQPAQAAEAKHQIETGVTGLSGSIRAAIKKDGALVVAERCSSPEFKGSVGQSIATIVTTLGFMGGLTDDCQNAYAALR